jgi:hypothetical protein
MLRIWDIWLLSVPSIRKIAAFGQQSGSLLESFGLTQAGMKKPGINARGLG